MIFVFGNGKGDLIVVFVMCEVVWFKFWYV